MTPFQEGWVKQAMAHGYTRDRALSYLEVIIGQQTHNEKVAKFKACLESPPGIEQKKDKITTLRRIEI